MTCMRRAASILLPLFTALAVAPVPSLADGGAPGRIRDVRIGAHSGFERLVIELDSETEVVWEKGPEPGEETFYVAAAPEQSSRVISTGLPHVGTVSVTAMKGGTHIAIEPRERNVRAYTLTNPPRLVVDFAPPGPEPFEAPAGSRALEPATTLGPLVVAPEPESAPAPTAAPTPAPAVEPMSQPEAPVLEAEAEADAGAEAAPEPAAAPPAPAPAKREPSAVPAADSARPFMPTDIMLVFVIGLMLLIGAVTAIAWSRRKRAVPSLSGFSPEEVAEEAELARARMDEITPAEILAVGDPEVLLERRVDDEVRARLDLEQRLVQANEELKTLRDRLHRLERRREGPD